MQPLTIDSVVIDPPLVLAPMAGVTHSPLRRLIASFASPGLFFSEMLSAKSLRRETPDQSLYLRREADEHPMAFQIFAAAPEDAAAACRSLRAVDPEIVDLNLACPAPEIAKKRKAGAHLLGDLQRTGAILAAMRREIPDRPLTVKFRLGRTPDRHFLRDLVDVFEGCGVDGVTLHPRVTGEKLKRRSRWEYIGLLKSMTRLPVIGNGDVASPADCAAMFAETGCDGVMIGRAAIERPWLFAEILGRGPRLDPPLLLATYQRACAAIADFFPERRALGRIKEFTWYYSRNLTFGHFFAGKIQASDSVAACRAVTGAHFESAC